MKKLKPREVRSLAWHHPNARSLDSQSQYRLIHTHETELVPATQAVMGRPPPGCTNGTETSVHGLYKYSHPPRVPKSSDLKASEVQSH